MDLVSKISLLPTLSLTSTTTTTTRSLYGSMIPDLFELFNLKSLFLDHNSFSSSLFSTGSRPLNLSRITISPSHSRSNQLYDKHLRAHLYVEGEWNFFIIFYLENWLFLWQIIYKQHMKLIYWSCIFFGIKFLVCGLSCKVIRICIFPQLGLVFWFVLVHVWFCLCIT